MKGFVELLVSPGNDLKPENGSQPRRCYSNVRVLLKSRRAFSSSRWRAGSRNCTCRSSAVAVAFFHIVPGTSLPLSCRLHPDKVPCPGAVGVSVQPSRGRTYISIESPFLRSMSKEEGHGIAQGNYLRKHHLLAALSHRVVTLHIPACKS